MMKTSKLMIIAAALVCGIGASKAQNTTSGYFLDNYDYRYQMNPAFGNEKDFVSMPGLGNLNVAMRGSLDVSSVIYTLNGPHRPLHQPRHFSRRSDV